MGTGAEPGTARERARTAPTRPSSPSRQPRRLRYAPPGRPVHRRRTKPSLNTDLLSGIRRYRFNPHPFVLQQKTRPPDRRVWSALKLNTQGSLFAYEPACSAAGHLVIRHHRCMRDRTVEHDRIMVPRGRRSAPMCERWPNGRRSRRSRGASRGFPLPPRCHPPVAGDGAWRDGWRYTSQCGPTLPRSIRPPTSISVSFDQTAALRHRSRTIGPPEVS